MKLVSNKYFIPISIILFMAVSFIIRVMPGYTKIFTESGIVFSMNDAYYHMRIVDNLVYNFPHLPYLDPYLSSAGYSYVGGQHFFDWILAGLIWIIGLGSPTESLVNAIGVYFPVILAMLTIIPVYFIGKLIFNKWAGLFAALLIAVMPGEFVGRSMLGATDHHILEVLLSTTSILFMLKALESSSRAKYTLYGVLSGLFLGLYLQTWAGGLLFVFILCLCMVCIICARKIKGLNIFKYYEIGVAIFAITWIVNYSKLMPRETLWLLSIAVLVFSALYGLFAMLSKLKIKPAFQVSGLFIIGALLIVLVLPSIKGAMASYGFFGSTGQTTLELQPFLFPRGEFTLAAVWGNFTIGLLLSIGAAIILLFKKMDSKLAVLLIWTVIITILSLYQRRYAYYLAVNVSLLSSYTCYFLIERCSKIKTKKRITYKTSTLVWMVVLALALMLPFNLSHAVKTTSINPYAPSPDWQNALTWLRCNTPEPFADKDYYYTFQGIKGRELYKYPEAEYSVASWWDYGYWITRTAKRVPISNPSQNPEDIKKVASLLLSNSETSEQIADELKVRYLILDRDTATSKFYAMVNWMGQDMGKYQEVYYHYQNQKRESVNVITSDYYDTLIVRLFSFNGEEIGGNPFVIFYTDNKVITMTKQFSSYDEAHDYIKDLDNAKVVGLSPYVCPIKIDNMSNFKLVYNSNNEVKIFEYTGN